MYGQRIGWLTLTCVLAGWCSTGCSSLDRTAVVLKAPTQSQSAAWAFEFFYFSWGKQHRLAIARDGSFTTYVSTDPQRPLDPWSPTGSGNLSPKVTSRLNAYAEALDELGPVATYSYNYSSQEGSGQVSDAEDVSILFNVGRHSGAVHFYGLKNILSYEANRAGSDRKIGPEQHPIHKQANDFYTVWRELRSAASWDAPTIDP